MFEDAEIAIKRIVDLVELCPKEHREKAFEMLLNAYLLQPAPRTPADQEILRPKQSESTESQSAADDSWKAGIPDDVLPRFKAMASRLRVNPEKLSDIFDFSAEPFTFAAIHVEGTSSSERTRKVALLAAARSFLATGKWQADWGEIKAMCTHQNCYDVSNFSRHLKAGEGDIFKKVENKANVQTSAKGQSEAEQLIAFLAGGPNASQE